MSLKILKYQDNILPDFLIIGGQKCGTTSLHYYLNCHPEIIMSEEKELNFFIAKKNWNKGVDWYKSQFKGKAKIYGETSPNYTNYPMWQGIAKRIYSVKPDIKLIYILRDPIERIISHYVHNYADERENLSFIEALTNRHHIYIYRSCYYLQIEQYLQYFSSDNILITSTEELSSFPEKTLQFIFQFLGVSDDISMIKYNKTLHRSVYKRRKNKIGNAIAKIPIMQKIYLLPPPYRDHIKKIIYFPFSRAIEKPKFSKNLRTKLISLLKEDVDKLRKYTGKSFEQWSL